MTERFYTKRETEAGISESIGFLLIFTIIIAGIGLVSLYGYPMLLQQQTNADESIMEKNMIVLQNDIKSLAYKTVPYKETALKIGSGTLTAFNYSHSPTLTIDYDGTTVETFQSGELLYESLSAQTNISIENGAVIKQPRLVQGSTMLAEPRWFYDGATHTMVINLINFNTSSDETLSRSGVGTVRMRLNETMYTSTGSPGNLVEIRYPSHYDVAWRNFLTDTNGLNMVNGGGNLYTKSNVATLVVKKFYIVIEAV